MVWKIPAFESSKSKSPSAPGSEVVEVGADGAGLSAGIGQSASASGLGFAGESCNNSGSLIDK